MSIGSVHTKGLKVGQHILKEHKKLTNTTDIHNNVFLLFYARCFLLSMYQVIS